MKGLIAILVALILFMTSCATGLDEKINEVHNEMITENEFSADLSSYYYDSDMFEAMLFDLIDLHDSAKIEFDYNDKLEDIVELRKSLDINSYFEIFRHIKVKEDYIFDFYYSPGPNGCPTLYFAKTEEYNPDIRSFYSVDAEGYVNLESRPQGRVNSVNEYSKYIELDGSRDSFVEFAILTTVAGQFALKWHANYFDHIPVISDGMVDYILENFWGHNITDTDINEVEKLDTKPRFETDGNNVILTFMFFTKWGGFIERTLIFDTSDGFNVIEIEEKTVLEYNCGIMF